jgi:hypothetical protein
MSMLATIVIKGSESKPLLADEFEIDVGHCHAITIRETIRTGELRAAFKNLCLTIPGVAAR